MFFSKLAQYVFSVCLLVGALAHVAHSAPNSFVYEGVLEDSNGPITSPTVLVLRIFDPSMNCLLYEENQTVTPGTDGSFSVRIGSAVGATKRTSSDPGLSLSTIFYSSGPVRVAGTNCSSGYTSTSTDSRSLVLNVNGTDLLPAIEINSAPFAINSGNADMVGGYVSSRLLRTDGSSALPALDDTKATLLTNLLNGTLGNPSTSGEVANKSYVDGAVSALLPVSTTFAGDVSGTFNALSVGKIKGKSIDDTGIASGKVLKYDGSQWVMGDDNVGSSGLTSLGGSTVGAQTFATPGTTGTAPTWTTNAGTGAHTLNIPLASTTGVTAGLLSKVDYDRIGLAEKISGKAVDSTSPSAAGQLLSYDSANSKWKASTASSPTEGQVLKWNNSTQNWEPGNPTVGWTAVDATYSTKGIVQFNTDAVTSGMNVTAGVASVVRTTTGEFNKILSLDGSGVANMYGAGLKGSTTGQVTLKAPTSLTSYTLTLPASTPTAGQSLQSDASGNLSWVNSLGSISNSATLTTNKIWVGNASNKAAEVSMSGDATIDNTGALTLASTITAGSNKGSAQTVPQISYDAKGRLTAVTEVTINDTTKLPLAGGTMTGAIAMGGQNLTNTGDITMAANKYLSLSANSTDGTAAGQMWYDSGTIKYFDGSTVKSLGVAGAGITSLNGLTAGTQTFAIGTSGTTPAFSSATSTHTLNIPLASGAGVTAGLLSKTDYDRLGDAETLNAKAFDLTAASAMGQILYFDSAADKWKVSAASAPSDGQVLKWNDTNKNWEPATDSGGWTAVDASYGAKGIVQFSTNAATSGVNVASGVATVVRTTTGTSSTILSLDGTGTANMYAAGIKGATSGTISLQAPATTANYSLTLPAAQGGANQVLSNNGSGVLSWVTPLTGVSNFATLNSSKIWVGNASNKAMEVPLSGDATLNEAGVLTLASTIASGNIVGSAQTIPQISYDAKGRLTAVTAVTIDDTSKLPKTGGSMTGAIDMGDQNISSTGNITMSANKYFSLSTNSTSGSSAGQMWYDSGTGTIKYFNGTSAVELGVAGAGITSLNGLTSGSQSFAVTTTGTSPLISSSGSTHTLSLPMASTAGTTAGLITKSEYDTFNNKQSTSLISGSVWVGNTSGVAEARSLSGDLSLSSTGVGTVAGIKGKLIDTSITALSTTGQVLFYNSSATKWKPSAAATPTNGQVLKWNSTNQNWEPAADNAGATGDASYAAKGLVQFDTDATTSGLSVTAGVAKVNRTTLGESNKILALDGSGVGQMFGAGLKGTVSGGVTLKAASTSATYTLTLPSGAPAAAQTLQSDAMGNLSWITPSGGGGSVNVANIKNASSIAQFPTTCTQSQTLFWNSALDIYECVNIKLNDVATVTTAAADYYVNSSGDDSLCSGSADAAVGAAPNCAFATLQGALNKIPHIIRHNTNLRVTSDLYAPGMNSVLASIDKVIAAIDSTTGPFLTIEGYNMVRYLDGGGYSGSSGIHILSPSRGVQLKNIYLQNFTSKAVEVMGGVAILEGVSLMYNTSALSVSQSGMALLFGNISISLASVGTDNRGIEVYHGSVSSEAAVNINLGSAQNSRGISVSHGDFSVNDSLAIIQATSSNVQTGVEISTGGQLYVKEGVQLSVSMDSGNTISSAMDVRGGALSVSGNLVLNSIGGRGLNCESGARCNIFGYLSVENFSGNASTFVSVRTGSTLNVQGNFEVVGTENATSSAVEISENSVFKYSPYQTGKTFTMTRGGAASGSTAIRLKTGSSFVVETGQSPTFNVSTYEKFYEAFNNSTVAVNGTISGAVPANAFTDKTSHYTNFSSGNIFPLPGRSCPSGMTSLGTGEMSFCIDTSLGSSGATVTYMTAVSNCASRNLKMCTIAQYVHFCSSVASISSSWAEGSVSTTCSSTSVTNSSMDPTGAKTYRCCL